MSQNIKVLMWNVRDLNSPAKHVAVLQVVANCDPNIICLQETKLQCLDLNIVMQCLGRNFTDFVYLPASGTRGGILLAWDSSHVSLSNVHHANYSITALVDSSEGRWWLSSDYGPHQDLDRPIFLQELRDIRDLHAGPWVILGVQCHPPPSGQK